MTSTARRWDVVLAVATGGALGSLARWGVATAVDHGRDDVPWSTFLVNVSGAFAIGVLMVFALEVRPASRYLRPFLGIGLLGGFTTFSAYAFDTRALADAGQAGLAAGYLFGTLVAGLVAVWFGIVAARLATQPRRGPRHRPRTRGGRHDI